MFVERLLFVYFIWYICFVLSIVVSNLIVILIVLDGFCWDFMLKVFILNFDFIVGGGVKVKYVENVFLMVVMLNLYIIVIGLYFESYGIIVNKMFDLDFNVMFFCSNNEIRWWDGVELIWVLN